MELKTAIEILEYHQEWRQGKRDDMIHEPSKLTEALDIVLQQVKNCDLADVRLSLPHEEMNEYQKTDVVLNMEGIPFMTLTESKLPNTWYHEHLPYLFTLSSGGFRVHNKGTKEGLFKRGFGRQ